MLHVQRAARTLARRYDRALRPAGLTNWQFSLMMALNRPERPSIGAVARLLGMDRSTVTASLKALARRGLVSVMADPEDGRSRLMRLTPAGRKALAAALPLWRREQAATVDTLGRALAARIRKDLGSLA